MLKLNVKVQPEDILMTIKTKTPVHTQYIDNIEDHDRADFISTRQLQLHFPAGRL